MVDERDAGTPRDAGVLIVEYRPDEIYLGRVELHPGHQGQGIGTHLIRQLLDEAAALGHPVTLDVLTVNHRAYQLYHRLGFREVERHGEGGMRIRMRADPDNPVGREDRCDRGDPHEC